MSRWDAAILLAIAAMLALAAIPVAWAGTEAAPEITDPTDDQTFTPAGQQSNVDCVASQVACPTFSRADILKVWINETATTIEANLLLNGVPGAPNAHSTRWQFIATAGTTTITAQAQANGGASPTAPAAGSNVASLRVTGNTLTLVINKATYGDPAVGSSLTNVFANGFGLTPAGDVVLATDRAPNTGGAAYVLTGGTGGGNGTGNGTGNMTGDADGDGLNDTWEEEQFGNATQQNGTGDPDADGLNNSAEFAAGTNATDPDTDGDDVQDGADPAPLDPNVPALTNTTDRDNDTLPDQWERQYFNNTGAQNATGDPDNDTLNNSREQDLGTDPTKADTDADGADDASDAFPLDATRSGNGDGSGEQGRPELYTGSAMFAAAATFCLLGLARRP